jgi:ABC-type phosphate transport system substrate-binding protein
MGPARAGTAVALAALLAGPLQAAEIVVVVHGSRQVSLTPADLARVYLKQRRHWPDGDPILPVNREAGSEARRLFERRVLGDQAGRLVVYWNQQYFRGVLPPATLASDEAVVRFVASEPRAIGYVAASAVDESVKVVLRLSFPADR